VVQPEVRDTHEVAEIARDEFKVVKEGRGCDLQIGVGKDVSALLQASADLPEDPSGRDVVREDCHGGKNTFLDVLQVAFHGSRAIRSLEEFADGHRTRELGISRNSLEPIQIGLERTGTE